MLNSSTLQSLIQINSDNISRVQAFYISYKDIMKDFRETGKSDDDAYAKYHKLAQKELAKMHLLERNQKALKKALEDEYYNEHMDTLCAEIDWLEVV